MVWTIKASFETEIDVNDDGYVRITQKDETGSNQGVVLIRPVDIPELIETLQAMAVEAKEQGR